MIKPGPPSKLVVSIAAICVGVGWLIICAIILVFAFVTTALILGLLPSRIQITQHASYGFLAIFGLFIACGLSYVTIALTIRCPLCGYKFLKNPKGLGPTSFVYHPSCPRKRGLNPWAIQIGRFLLVRKMRCINCGEELFN